jgi:hypothetical protein
LLALVLIYSLSMAGPLVIRPVMSKLAAYLALREFETAFQDVQHPANPERLSLHTIMGDFSGSKKD